MVRDGEERDKCGNVVGTRIQFSGTYPGGGGCKGLFDPAVHGREAGTCERN